MNTNDILYMIQKSINLTHEDMLKAYSFTEYNMSALHLDSILKRKNESDFKVCTYEELGVFLDGFITLKRGASPTSKQNNDNVELTNNLILKKLRIALELKESELEIIFGLGEVKLTKQQLSSLFRNEKHKNFKLCSDKLLLDFLNGLDEFYFIGTIDE